MNKISVIVPCFNEEEVLPLFYQQVKQTLERIKNITYEILFIDDGSSDHTKDFLRILCNQDQHCEFVSFSRNFGKEAAMFAGLKKANGDYVVIMDADLQHPPYLLKEMYHAVNQEGYDCCAGKRVDRTGEGKLRNFLSHSFYKIMQKICKMDMSDGAGDFRMMSRQMVNAILELKEYNRYMKGLFSFVGFDTKWIEYHNVARAAGHSKWNFRQLFSYALEGMFSFSTAPVVWIGNIGCMIMIISIVIILFGLVFHTSQFFKLVCLILFLSGLQMLFVAIIGQYTTKDYLESKQRPIYIVKETSKNLTQ
ncbi:MULTISPECIES: glycosyltransferase family 2 protein [Coprobacillaceae]|uniref:glycosyltransferase family 2 protein n=1 Tax=Coprobacillaceae TaxID=2810280 RepID=UPI000E47AF23|nr:MULTISPECIES: glycosyltransferase family 2 protein [Coprobacillaceae]RHM61661.1 glycosyltransferase [Coprobacillus sp. AF33-1AC]RHS92495.1 glycosyltransferase [Erysipelatoclostridium sp. AM42-17]